MCCIGRLNNSVAYRAVVRHIAGIQYEQRSRTLVFLWDIMEVVECKYGTWVRDCVGYA